LSIAKKGRCVVQSRGGSDIPQDRVAKKSIFYGRKKGGEETRALKTNEKRVPRGKKRGGFPMIYLYPKGDGLYWIPEKGGGGERRFQRKESLRAKKKNRKKEELLQAGKTPFDRKKRREREHFGRKALGREEADGEDHPLGHFKGGGRSQLLNAVKQAKKGQFP